MKLQPITTLMTAFAVFAFSSAGWAQNATPEEARAIANEAYSYGSPLVANPINCYLIKSPMLPDLKKDADGGLAIYIQNESSPGADKEPSRLPAPKAPIAMYMRLYWPAEAALNASWQQPQLDMAK